jgi:hypothetical protein
MLNCKYKQKKTMNKIALFVLFGLIIFLFLPSHANASVNILTDNGFDNVNNIEIDTSITIYGVTYFGTANPTNGAEVWKLEDNILTKIVDQGYGNPLNIQVTALAHFQNGLLITIYNLTEGLIILRYDLSTEALTTINIPGFGNPDGGINTYGKPFFVLNDELYIGVNCSCGASIWKYDNGTNWSRMSDLNFGELGSRPTWATSYFDNKQYIFIGNASVGGQAWSTTDGNTYVKEFVDLSMQNGLGNAANRSLRGAAVFNNQLYIGTGNANGFELWNYNGSSLSNIITGGYLGNQHTHVEETAMAVFDNRLFFGGVSSANDPKLFWIDSDHNVNYYDVNTELMTAGTNRAIASLTASEDCLYIGTGNTAVNGISVIAMCYPELNNDEITINAENSSYNIDILANDISNTMDIDSLQIIDLPTNGQVSIVNGELIYTVNNINNLVDDTLVYEVCTLQNLCRQARVNIYVANNVPSITSVPLLTNTGNDFVFILIISLGAIIISIISKFRLNSI